MSFIRTIPESEAVGETASLYEIDRNASGYLPNYTKAFSHRPRLFDVWKTLNATVKSTMDPRRYELATVGAAVALQSSYCTLAHGERLLTLGSDEEEVRSLTGDEPTLGEQERAVADFAAKVARSASSITQEDVDRLRLLGLEDAEIFDVAAAAAARCFFSKLLDATGTRPDAIYRERIPGLVADLTVGRPLADSD